MAQAFYPTNDGHVGNLEKKTTRELHDLLARQEKMIHNRKLLAMLPDGRARVLQFASQLRDCIHRREGQARIKKSQAMPGKQPDNLIETKGVSKFKQETLERQRKTDDTEMDAGQCFDSHNTESSECMDSHNGENRAVLRDVKSSGRDVVVLGSGVSDASDSVYNRPRGADNAMLNDQNPASQHEDTISTGIGSITDNWTITDNVSITNSVTTTIMDNLDVESGFQALSLGDGVVNEDEPHKHFYEIAEQRAMENKGLLKNHFMLNRHLKISSVHDLPPEFTPHSTKGHIEGHMDEASDHKEFSKPHLKTEDSAATPPVYKYKVKVISLDESISLQQRHKSRQEELQAELAAERLLQRLDIKMEPYNPEGTDMSYRVDRSDNKLYAVDSDDNSGDEDANLLHDLLSDVDD